MNNRHYYLILTGIIACVIILSPFVTKLSNEVGTPFAGYIIGGQTVTPDISGMITLQGQNGLSVIGSGSQIIISNPGTLHITGTATVNWNSGYKTSWYDDNFKIRGNSFNEVKASEIAGGTIQSISVTPSINTQTGNTIITLYHNGASTGLSLTIPPHSTSTETQTFNYVFGSSDSNNWVISSNNPNQQTITFTVKQNITYNN